jgi:hypothetical protein
MIDGTEKDNKEDEATPTCTVTRHGAAVHGLIQPQETNDYGVDITS